MFWRRPLVWIAAGWVCGMAAAAARPAMWVAGGAAAAAAGMLAAHGVRRKGALAALLVAAAFAAGGARFELAESRNVSALPLGDEQAARAAVTGVVASAPAIDGDFVAFDLEARVVMLEAASADGASDETTFVESGSKGGTGESIPLEGERMKTYVKLEAEAELAQASRWKRGDVVTVTGELRRPAVATNFGGFDYRRYLERRGMFWTVRGEGAGSVGVASGAEQRRWTLHRALRYVDEGRAAMGGRIDRLFDPPVSGFMKGLLLGAKDDLDPERYRTFSQIGLTHILAISGLHVGLFVGASLWALGRLPIARETRLLLAMAAVPAYVVFTGAAPSAVRAGLMAMIALYAARRHLLKDGLHLLAASAMLMLAWDPYYLFDVGFQLSFAVTAGLILLVPPCDERLGRFVRWRPLRSALSVTLVAQLVSFPLTIRYFNGFSLLSFPANFALVPIFSLAVLPLGSIALLASFASEAAAKAAAFPAERLTALCFEAVDRLASVQAASTIWASPPGWWIAAYFALLWTGARAASGRMPLEARARRAVAASCGALLVVLCVYAYAPNVADRAALVSVIDVGQGDAILVRTPSGKHLLIDGGGTVRFGKPEDAWRARRDPFEVGDDVVVPLLQRRGVQALDAVFVTHADSDHIGGLQAVLERIPVRALVFNGTVKEGATSEKLYRTAIRKGIPLVPASRGWRWDVDGATRIDVLYPEPAGGGLRVEPEQNEQSLAFLLTVYGRKLLFTGDIGAAEELRIVSAGGLSGGGFPTVDVLKIAHHGSKTSTTEAWIQAWRPKAAVVSVGRTNVYGHPHPTVVERLDRYGVRTFRTDAHGEVQFRIESGAISVRTMLER